MFLNVTPYTPCVLLNTQQWKLGLPGKSLFPEKISYIFQKNYTLKLSDAPKWNLIQTTTQTHLKTYFLYLYSEITADLVYLANFLNPKIYSNFNQMKFLILALASRLAYLTSPAPRKTPTLAQKSESFQIKTVSYNYTQVFFLILYFFYTQPAFVFHLLIDFCITHDQIVVFFLFLLYKDFDIFQDCSFCSLSLLSW